MTWNYFMREITVYMLVFSRMGGMVFFNPFFSRRSVPPMLRAAFALMLTLVVAPHVAGTDLPQYATLGLMLALLKEMIVGMAISVVMIFFFYFLFLAGEVIDMGFGFSMAKIFDPSSNLQVSVSGNLFQMIFILYFFLTGCHLQLIRAMANSFQFIHVGAVVVPAALGSFMVLSFLTAFALCMQLAMPFIAASFTEEVAMGILMKLVPQISIFAVDFQIKNILGYLLLIIYAAPVNAFLQRYLTLMFSNISSVLQQFA